MASVVKASRLLAVQTPPASSKSVSYQLLYGNAYIQQIGTGLFGLLPVGQRVISRLTSLIERELDAIGAQKVTLPIMGPKELWDTTGRWESMGSELFKLEDRKEKQYCLQPTAEEMMTDFIGSHSSPPASSFPFLLYQTTQKFRDEMNPRFGLLRGREFIMNDLYSFDLGEDKATETYERVGIAYETILRDRLGLEVYKVRADSGVHGGKVSHEYHVRDTLEEDALEMCTGCGKHYKFGELSNPDVCCEGAKKKKLSSIEVAHTFHLGTKYSEALKAYAGKRQTLDMCCFGIGVSRLLAATVESLCRPHSSHISIHLPRPIQPFDVAVIPAPSLLGSTVLEKLLESLKKSLFSEENPSPAILLDDRHDPTIGRKVVYAQQMGLSRVIVLGKGTEKTKDTDPLFELWSSDPFKGEKLTRKADLNLNELLVALPNA